MTLSLLKAILICNVLRNLYISESSWTCYHPSYIFSIQFALASILALPPVVSIVQPASATGSVIHVDVNAAKRKH